MKYAVGMIIILFFITGGWYLVSKSVNDENHSSDEMITIVTSFYPLQFALEGIVGELGTVTNIGAGRDPHDFEPSTQDMVVLQQADLVVLQGADFEPWGDDVMVRLESDAVPVVIATAPLTLHEGGHQHEEHEEDNHAEESHDEKHEAEEGHEHDHGMYDPHTWLSPVLFSQMVDHLTDEIIAIDPTNAAIFQENTAVLKAELATLDTEYANRLANCSLSEVITSHEAFGYVADQYNFSVHSIAGLSTQDTPSVATLAELRAEAQEGIGAILLEENSITAYGETLARETGLQTLSINPIAYIIPEGEDYLSLMRANLDTFATALSCDV